VGRPSSFTEELADEIFERIASGESMRMICEDANMPHRSTVIRWMAENTDFATKCARAREFQSDVMDDLILDTANACTSETAQADKVKIAAYQWRASKLAPKKYGDKLELEHSGNVTVQVVNYGSQTSS
jgi:cobalamin biosynthesis Mg chelatase CobN